MVNPHLGTGMQVKKILEDRVKKPPVSFLPRSDKSWNTLSLGYNGLNSGKALECEKQWKVLLSLNIWLIFLLLLLPGPNLFGKSWNWLRKCADKHIHVSYIAWFAHEFVGVGLWDFVCLSGGFFVFVWLLLVVFSVWCCFFLGVLLHVWTYLQFVLRLIDLALRLLNTMNHVGFVYFELYIL